MQRSRAFGFAALASAAVLIAAGCGGTAGGGSEPVAADGASMESLYQAAQEAGESTIVVYGVDSGACYDRFSERFPGISVEVQYMVGETLSRVQQEAVSGQQVGDVLRTGSTSFLQLADAGLMESFRPVTADGIPEDFFGPDNTFVAVTQRAGGIAYNSQALSEAEAPRGWRDLTDPRYEGQIVMPDPTGPGAGASLLTEMMVSGKYDEEYVRQLAANDPALIQGARPAAQSMISGEFPIMIGGIDQTTIREHQSGGAPVEWVFPPEGGIPVTRHFVGVIKGAPHPNAARLLETWLLSEEGQTCLTEQAHEYSVRPDATPPEGLPRLSELAQDEIMSDHQLDQGLLTKQTEHIELLGQIFN